MSQRGRMTDADTAAPKQSPTPPAPTLPKEEIARLGKDIYERDIRRQVEADHAGEIVAIDVGSGNYALGKNAIAASEGLRELHPDAQVWLMRVGHRTLYHFGGGSLRRTK